MLKIKRQLQQNFKIFRQPKRTKAQIIIIIIIIINFFYIANLINIFYKIYISQ